MNSPTEIPFATEISPSTKFLLDEIRKLFSEQNAKWDQWFADRDAKWDQRWSSRGTSSPPATTTVASSTSSAAVTASTAFLTIADAAAAPDAPPEGADVGREVPLASRLSSTAVGMAEIVDSTGSFSVSRLQAGVATLLQTSPATFVQDTVREASRDIPVPIQSAACGAVVAADSWDGLFDGGDDSDEQQYERGRGIDSCLTSTDPDTPTIAIVVSPVDAGEQLLQCGPVDTKYIPASDKELEVVEVDEDYDSTQHKLSDPISEEVFDPFRPTCYNTSKRSELCAAVSNNCVDGNNVRTYIDAVPLSTLTPATPSAEVEATNNSPSRCSMHVRNNNTSLSTSPISLDSFLSSNKSSTKAPVDPLACNDCSTQEYRYINYIYAHLIGVILPCCVIPVHVAHEVFEGFNTQIVVSLVPLLVDLVDVVPWPPPTQLKMQSTDIQLRPIPWPSFSWQPPAQYEVTDDRVKLRPVPWPSFWEYSVNMHWLKFLKLALPAARFIWVQYLSDKGACRIHLSHCYKLVLWKIPCVYLLCINVISGCVASTISNWKSAVGLIQLSQHALLVGFGCYQLQRTRIRTSLLIWSAWNFQCLASVSIQWVTHIASAQLRPIPWPSFGSHTVVLLEIIRRFSSKHWQIPICSELPNGWQINGCSSNGTCQVFTFNWISGLHLYLKLMVSQYTLQAILVICAVGFWFRLTSFTPKCQSNVSDSNFQMNQFACSFSEAITIDTADSYMLDLSKCAVLWLSEYCVVEAGIISGLLQGGKNLLLSSYLSVVLFHFFSTSSHWTKVQVTYMLYTSPIAEILVQSQEDLLAASLLEIKTNREKMFNRSFTSEQVDQETLKINDEGALCLTDIKQYAAFNLPTVSKSEVIKSGARHSSLVNSLSASMSKYVPKFSCKLSEDILSCIAAVYCKLSSIKYLQAPWEPG